MVVFAERRRRLAAAGAAVAALAGLAALALAAVSPPAARRANAPADEFSAGRAYAHVRTIGAQTHVAGSPASDQVSRYLVGALTEAGVSVQAQHATGLDTKDAEAVAAAQVKNVIGMIDGTEPTGRVFLVAHYDSVQVGPGGSDDGAGVATVLETMRALAAGPPPRNDVVALFTDAEEACLCGAEAFVKQNPLATQGGVALNFEARGTRGPAIMFETSRGNASLAKAYAQVPRPVATSFAVEVYRMLPTDTDFTRFREDPRFTGLNSAFIDGVAAYHTPQDTPSRLDRRSLQHHGDAALALVRALAGADLSTLARPAGHDDTYFPALGMLVRYPGWLVWPLAILAVLAVAAVAWLARRRGEVRWTGATAGLGLTLVPLVVAPVVAQLLWVALVAARPGYAEMIDPWRPGWYRWAVVALCATVLLGWYALLRRRLGPVTLALGGLGWLALLGVVLAAVAPGGSYLTALPALFGAAALAGALPVRPPIAALSVLVAGGAVAIVVLAPTVALFFPALGLAAGGAPALFVVLLGLALLPVLDLLFTPSGAARTRRLPDGAPAQTGRRRRSLAASLPAAACGLLAIGCVTAGLATDRFDARHPMPSQLMYVMDADTGEAHWVSKENVPDAWTKQYVHGRESLADAYPILEGRLATGPATTADLPPPRVTVVSDATSGGERALWLRLIPQRPVRLAYLRVEGSPVVRAVIAGREVSTAQRSRFGVLFHAPPAGGIDIRLVVRPGTPLTLRAIDGSTGLTGLPGFRPRPPGVGIAGDHLSELVLVARTIQLKSQSQAGGGEGPGTGPGQP
jgi:Zn-dependent M28 family amino/carboxypeptidase